MSTSIEFLPNDNESDYSGYNTDNSENNSISHSNNINENYNKKNLDKENKNIFRESTSNINNIKNNSDVNTTPPVPQPVPQPVPPPVPSPVQPPNDSHSIPNLETLPSRDNPVDPLTLNSDQQVLPSYFNNEPQDDYIREFENIETIKNNAKNEKQQIDNYEKYFSYIFNGFLYLFFQLPFFKSILRLSIPKLFNEEGFPNFSYHIFLAIIFSLSYYLCDNYLITFLNLQ